LSEDKRILGTDLKLYETELGADLALTPTGDIESVSGDMNLAQAIVHRIRTGTGELTDIGHSTYGSRLYDMIGQPNTERTRELVRNITRECLSQDPRVKEIVSIIVRVPIENLNRVDIDVTIIPIASTVPLNIVIPFYLEVA